MSRQEIQNQISEISNELYQNSYCYGDKTEAALKRKLSKLRKQLISLTPEFTPGAEIALDDFIIRINKPKAKENAKKKFFKDNEYQFSKEDKSIMEEMFPYYYDAFAYFNKNYTPTDFKSTELSSVKEEVKSNNIYDRMCAKSESEMRLEFKIRIKYDEEPITVVKEFTKNTTLSRSEVRGFM